MAIPTDRNTSVKVTEKLSKYKDLEIEIERMWGMKLMVQNSWAEIRNRGFYHRCPRPSKPTTTGTKSSKMAQTQFARYVVNSRNQ